MENVPTNWCISWQKRNFDKSWQKCKILTKMHNLGCFWTLWKPRPAKNFFFPGNLKPWPNVKLCTGLQNVLAKIPKIIPRNKKKGILDNFRAHYWGQREHFESICVGVSSWQSCRLSRKFYEHLFGRTYVNVCFCNFCWGITQVKVPSFYFHVTQEGKVENQRKFVHVKLKISFCFIFV